MEYFSQRKKGYEKIKLGFGPSDLYNYGCFVVSLANLSGIDPIEVNAKLKKEGCFDGDLVISSERMAGYLGLEYNGRDSMVSRNPKYRTIAEVDMSTKKGIQQHFVVIKEDGSIIDPWTGTIRPKGTYPLVSYRLFKKIVKTPEAVVNVIPDTIITEPVIPVEELELPVEPPQSPTSPPKVSDIELPIEVKNDNVEAIIEPWYELKQLIIKWLTLLIKKLK